MVLYYIYVIGVIVSVVLIVGGIFYFIMYISTEKPIEKSREKLMEKLKTFRIPTPTEVEASEFQAQRAKELEEELVETKRSHDEKNDNIGADGIQKGNALEEEHECEEKSEVQKIWTPKK